MVDETQSLGEATVIAAPRECPVCGTSNAAAELWCTECGFRLDAVPGEAPAGELTAAVVRLVSQLDGAEHPLFPGTHLVGRSQEADVMLRHPSVSRRHAQIVVDGEGVQVEDLGSTNGTRVDGVLLKPGEPVRLTRRARIAFGEVELIVEGLPEPTAETAEGAEAQIPPAERGPVLVGEDGRVLQLAPGVNTVGRRGDNTIVIPDPYVSGQHAEISVQDTAVLLTDKASTNGTLVNGERLSPDAPRELQDGDTVTFARVSFTFHAKPPTGAVEG